MLSNQADSGEKTYSVIDSIINMDSNIINVLNFVIRKMAHITEYFILIFLVYILLKEYNVKYIYIYSFIFSFMYAISDEVHQSFVGGRTATFRDVLIDSIGMFIFLSICYVKKKYHGKK